MSRPTYDTLIALYPDGTFILMGYHPDYHEQNLVKDHHQKGTRFFIMDCMEKVDTLKKWIAGNFQHENIKEVK